MNFLDRLFSRVLRYDLAREDLAKWVVFARQVFGAMLVLVVVAAGISGVVSTKQSERLLRGALDAQGSAVADALARASYVPVSLDDRRALDLLVASLEGVRNVSHAAVLDSKGKVLEEATFPGPQGDPMTVRAPIVPPKEFEEDVGTKPIGTVEVVLSSERVDRAALRVALFNLAVTGGLILLVSLVGVVLTRNLVVRMQALVGEARLVEQIRQANAELEAFSYSVSHDLRAPLRSITGFTQILSTHAGPQLDEKSRGHLERVIAASKRMAQIIDDLLALSRVGRREISRKPVDLSELAARILDEFKARDPLRKVETAVAPGALAACDEHLTTIALENLLGNAWKYTSKKPEARVEFGHRDQGGERVFFVKDDGAGFDPRFAQKLFEPFQRLHREAEFEGTGIGLATVKRIIQRHGGRIWGESEPDKGATFYFTLEPKGDPWKRG